MVVVDFEKCCEKGLEVAIGWLTPTSSAAAMQTGIETCTTWRPPRQNVCRSMKRDVKAMNYVSAEPSRAAQMASAQFVGAPR